MPLPTDSIDPVPYSGELNTFDGGYAVGDTIGDFRLWSLDGDDFILSNEIDPEKPTIIFNGSATCIRFQNDWDINQPNNVAVPTQIITTAVSMAVSIATCISILKDILR